MTTTKADFDFTRSLRGSFGVAENATFTANLSLGYINELFQVRFFQEALRTGAHLAAEKLELPGDKTDMATLRELLNPIQVLSVSVSSSTFLFKWGYISINFYPENFTLHVYGEENFIEGIKAKVLDRYGSDRKFVEWVYSDSDSVSLPIKTKPIINSAYPKINEKFGSVKSFIDEYVESDASILIFIGPPGTGKTSLIKHIIAKSTLSTPAMVTYDPALMVTDQFFAKYMASSHNFLVIEDADAILAAREGGNSLMQRFLNLGDGLVTTNRKKIIFSTNLPHIGDIDPALLRPGRCFAVVEFDALTISQSLSVLKEIGRPDDILPDNDGQRLTLAEVVGGVVNPNHTFKREFGFI
jgi:hypothetical protein